MRALQAACRELAMGNDILPDVVYVSEHKTQYVLKPCSLYPHCGNMTYQWYTPNDFVKSNLL